MFSTSTDEMHYLERLVHVLVHVVYQSCSANPFSTVVALASMTAVRKTGLSHTS